MGKGTKLKLANERRLVSDVVRAAQNMPMAGIQRDLDLSLLNLYRMKTRPRISWDVLMMRAYSLVARDCPELRQAYTRLPRPHLYQHHENVCLLTIARQYHGRERLFFARFGSPDQHTLVQLQEKYNYYRDTPVHEIKQFRHQIWFARVPLPLRRFLWWNLFNVWPKKRASHMGTFGMSISRYKGAMGCKHLGPNTTILGVDPRPRNGICRLLLTFDHRVLDGKPAADALEKLRDVLENKITREVQQLLEQNNISPDIVRKNNAHRLNRAA